MTGRLVGALVCAAVAVGLVSGSTWALWSARADTPVTAGVGVVHFAAGDPAVDGGLLTDAGTFVAAGEGGRSADGDGVSWTLPGRVLADVAPGVPQTAVVQVDGFSQGNRGLSFTVDGVTVDGDRGLADELVARVSTVDSVGACVPGGAVGVTLFEGRLVDVVSDPVVLVGAGEFTQSSGYGSWDVDSVSALVCVEVALPDVAPVFVGEVTASGSGLGADGVELVESSDVWEAVIVPTAGQRSAVVGFALSYGTFRPGVMTG